MHTDTNTDDYSYPSLSSPTVTPTATATATVTPNGDGYTQADAYCEATCDTETAADSAAKPLRELAWRFWGAHVSHVLVSASRRNNLSGRVTN